MKSVSLFTGAGGLDYGLSCAGIDSLYFCEQDPGARAILSRHFPEVPCSDDVYTVDTVPSCDVMTLGFPCKDLSLLGTKKGIDGPKSKAVRQAFRLIAQALPEWLIIENVPRLLVDRKGKGMEYLRESCEALGYHWAWRVIDLRAFGIPQRRCRLLWVASRTQDPRSALLTPDVGERWTKAPWLWTQTEASNPYGVGPMTGFDVSAGKTGAGWTENGVPTLVAGSARAQPKPVAIWDKRTDTFGFPSLRDAERLQTFPDGWTQHEDVQDRKRWWYIGNAVPCVVGEWLGERLHTDYDYTLTDDTPQTEKWSKYNAGWGGPGQEPHVCGASHLPVQRPYIPLHLFLKDPIQPMSRGWAEGWHTRAQEGRLRFHGQRDAIIQSMSRYLEKDNT